MKVLIPVGVGGIGGDVVASVLGTGGARNDIKQIVSTLPQ